ncbi:dual OB domain-containing protein [Picosynechococcus sp. PCC 73109]|uniref:dual OB domain-containing protein n=1 Tax=Picosynechococcus sp. PCC 73109 TaxID=374982 RepID=UPI000745881D|nr:hypothetical protein [Picosynechococcus sp. PCC 73109]AMA08918.1 hypothetical protein AWQ23_06100 [Picosynechococcus sp. PCC 73109]
MPSLKRIVCLANSWKLEERCIAGIELETGKWIRPVCDNLYPEDGRVPRFVRMVEGREPELLDILEIPLDDTGNGFGFECENLSVLPGEWRLSGKWLPTQVIDYCENFSHILHNSLKYVNPSKLKVLPFHQRRTLQLVQTNNLSVKKSSMGSTGWRGSFQTTQGQVLRDAKITDPVFAEKLEAGYQTTGNYLIIVSLGMPWAPRDDWDGEAPCWKLIAGVIELELEMSNKSLS